MRPIDQTAYSLLNSNCFSACLASILEISLGDVPYFSGPGHPGFLPWLANRGLFASLYRADGGVPLGYAIAGGPSTRFAGKMHACVAFNGIVVHDPHPSRGGLPLGIVAYVVIHEPHGGGGQLSDP